MKKSQTISTRDISREQKRGTLAPVKLNVYILMTRSLGRANESTVKFNALTVKVNSRFTVQRFVLHKLRY